MIRVNANKIIKKTSNNSKYHIYADYLFRSDFAPNILVLVIRWHTIQLQIRQFNHQVVLATVNDTMGKNFNNPLCLQIKYFLNVAKGK